MALSDWYYLKGLDMFCLLLCNATEMSLLLVTFHIFNFFILAMQDIKVRIALPTTLMRTLLIQTLQVGLVCNFCFELLSFSANFELY